MWRRAKLDEQGELAAGHRFGASRNQPKEAVVAFASSVVCLSQICSSLGYKDICASKRQEVLRGQKEEAGDGNIPASLHSTAGLWWQMLAEGLGWLK